VFFRGFSSTRLITNPTLIGFFTLRKTPKGFSKTLHAVKNPLGFFWKPFRFFSQRAPHRAGFVICVGEKPLKNPYF
jgi:hypothetical protein